MLTVSEIAQIQVAWYAYAFDALIDDKHDNSRWLEKFSFAFIEANTHDIFIIIYLYNTLL